MRLLYKIATYLIVLGSLCKKRSRHHFRQRLGKDLPDIDKKGRRLIWIHAVSFGETKAIVPLVRKLKAQKEAPLILFSSGTATAYAEAKRIMPECDVHLPMPFDISWVIRPFVKRVRPDLVVIVETDLWWHFQSAAKKVGSSIVVVNGKLSERSFMRYERLPKLASLMFSSIDLFCVQGKLYAERLVQLNLPKEKIVVTGNIKLDGLAEEGISQEWREKLGVNEGDLVFTCGSTHDPEEKILLDALKKVWERFPRLKVLLVPRHPERFDEVAALLEKEKISFGRWSERASLRDKRVLLIDAMGQLRKCYQVSTVTFVGGSLTDKVGGHNILEPAYAGVPVLYGPYMYSQPNLLDLMRSYEAGIEVSQENLVFYLEELLENPSKRQEMGKRGLRLVEESKGSTEATYKALAAFFPLA